MMEIVKLFFYACITIFLVAQQTRNATQSHYVFYFLTAFVITIFWSLGVKSLFASHFGYAEIIVYAFGSGIGGITGIWLHKKIAPKKRWENGEIVLK